MPQSTPERRARWGMSEDKAEKYLLDAGYSIHRFVMSPPSADHVITETEEDAVLYLLEEWDYGWRS